MSLLTQKCRCLFVASNFFLKRCRQTNVPLVICSHNHDMPSSAKALQKSARLSGSAYDTDLICKILERGGKWDYLNANCTSVKLSDAIVQKVLLDFREPINAKKALLFFHWCSQQQKHQHCIYSYCMMVHILVNAGLLVDAKALLESAIRKSYDSEGSKFSIVKTFLNTYETVLPCPHVFDILVSSFTKLRMFEAALETCENLGDHRFTLSLSTFNNLLHVVQKSDKFGMVWKVFEHMIIKRKYPNQMTIEIMIHALCKGGDLQKMVCILDRIHGKRCSPCVLVSTALALRIIEEENFEEVMILLKRMLQKNMILDDVAYSLSVYTYCKMGNLELAYATLDEMLKRGHDANSFIYSSLIQLNCKEGKIGEAYHLMQEMSCSGLKPYDETYNVLIYWSCRNGRLKESITFYNDMLSRGFLPSQVSCNTLLKKLCETGEVKKANNMLTILLDKGFMPDEVAYSILIDGFGKIGSHQEVMKLYYEMEGKGPSPSLVTYTSLIRSLSECGMSKEAEKMATIIKEKLLANSKSIGILPTEHRKENCSTRKLGSSCHRDSCQCFGECPWGLSGL